MKPNTSLTHLSTPPTFILKEKMDASSSGCSSGCDSGWTLYFQPSSSSSSSRYIHDDDMLPGGDPKNGGFEYVEEEEEDDLSMVSDASSGPPAVHNEAQCGSTSPAARKDNYKRQKMNKQGQGRDLRSAMLDDTASSPAVVNNHYAWKAGVGVIPEGGGRRRRSAYQEQHFGFLHGHDVLAAGEQDNQLGGLGGET